MLRGGFCCNNLSLNTSVCFPASFVERFSLIHVMTNELGKAPAPPSQPRRGKDGGMDELLLLLLSLLSGLIVSWLRLWRKLKMRGIKRTKLYRKPQLWGLKSTPCAGTSRCVFRTLKESSRESSDSSSWIRNLFLGLTSLLRRFCSKTCTTSLHHINPGNN